MTVTTKPLAHPFFDREARLWGVAEGPEDEPGFVGPHQRWRSFSVAHDTAQALNRVRYGQPLGVWL